MVESFVAKKKTESLDGTLADVLFCNVGACLIHLRPLILMDNDIQSRTTRLTPSVSGNWARESCGRVSFNIPALFPSTLNADGTLKFLFHSLALSLSLFLVSSIRFVSIAKGMTSSQNVRAPHPSVSIEISGNCVATVWSRSTIRVVSNQIQTQYVCRLTSATGFCDWRSVRADIHFLHLYRRHIWLNNTFDEQKGWKKYYEIKFIFVFFWKTVRVIMLMCQASSRKRVGLFDLLTNGFRTIDVFQR